MVGNDLLCHSKRERRVGVGMKTLWLTFRAREGPLSSTREPVAGVEMDMNKGAGGLRSLRRVKMTRGG